MNTARILSHPSIQRAIESRAEEIAAQRIKAMLDSLPTEAPMGSIALPAEDDKTGLARLDGWRAGRIEGWESAVRMARLLSGRRP